MDSEPQQGGPEPSPQNFSKLFNSRSFFSYTRLKLKLRMFLAGHIVANGDLLCKIDDCNLLTTDWEFVCFHYCNITS